MSVSNLLWAGGFTGSDGRSYRESVADAAEAVRLAGAMKAGCVVVYSGARGGHTANHARQLLTGALEELTPLAVEQGVTLALEPMHPACAADWTFLTGLDDALSVIEKLGSPAIKLVFDTYHLCQDRAVIDRIAQIAPRVAVVHLADSKRPPERDQDRCLLGEGTLPLAEIIAAFSSAGYDGYYDVELMGEEIETRDYDELVQHARQAFDRLV